MPASDQASPGGSVPPGRPLPPPAASGPWPGRTVPPSSSVPEGFLDVLAAWPAAVALLTVADGRDDIGSTVSALCPVSADPPLVLVSLIDSSYPAEVLSRALPFAVTLLAASQRVLAGRFASAGRPSARVLLADVPHHRGEFSGALLPDGGLAALECEVRDTIQAGDHLLVVAGVVAVAYAAESGDALIRFRGRYLR